MAGPSGFLLREGSPAGTIEPKKPVLEHLRLRHLRGRTTAFQQDFFACGKTVLSSSPVLIRSYVCTAARQRLARASITSQRPASTSAATNKGATKPTAKTPAAIQSVALCSSTPLVGTIFR